MCWLQVLIWGEIRPVSLSLRPFIVLASISSSLLLSHCLHREAGTRNGEEAVLRSSGRTIENAASEPATTERSVLHTLSLCFKVSASLNRCLDMTVHFLFFCFFLHFYCIIFCCCLFVNNCILCFVVGSRDGREVCRLDSSIVCRRLCATTVDSLARDLMPIVVLLLLLLLPVSVESIGAGESATGALLI